MLRRSSGESGVLANLMDEVLTYSSRRDSGKEPARAGGDTTGRPKDAASQQGTSQLSQDRARLMAFESNAAQILKSIAHNSRFAVMEAANQSVTPLPFLPGEEINATVVGTLPGGRAFVQVAGSALELSLPRAAQTGEILRLTYISSQPKPTFASPRTQPDSPRA
jgi:hypothetical protein